MDTWTRTRAKVNNFTTTYREIRLPKERGQKLIESTGRGYFNLFSPDGSPINCRLSGWGETYLLYRLHAYRKVPYIDRDDAREAMATNYASFCKLINRGTRYMLTANYKEAKRDVWIGAFDKHNFLMGLMTSYNPFSHAQVLDMIEEAELTAQVKWSSVSDVELKLFIGMKSLGVHNAEFGMVITNGETGHVALGYHAAIKVDGYIYTWPLSATRRHLSKLDEAKKSLQVALEECQNIAILNCIKNLPVAKLKLASKDADLSFYIHQKKDKPIAELIAIAARYRGKSGHKTEAEKLLTQIFKGIKGELNS